MKNNKAKIWLALRLSHIELESLGIQRDNINIIISHKNRVCAATDNLIARGVEIGSPTSTAQLLHDCDDETPCRTYEREEDSEEQTIIKLCETLYNYTPHIEIYRVDTQQSCQDCGLLLELSRCIKLFKGLENLVKEIHSAIQTENISYYSGIGHTKHCAWLLSYKQETDNTGNQASTHIIKKINSLQEDKNAFTRFFIEQLKNCPLTLIHEHKKSVQQLKKTGFFTFEDITKHIEQESFYSLRVRFGEDFSDYIADTLGIDSDLRQICIFNKPIKNYTPREIFIESIQFDYPVRNSEQLHHPVKKLLEYLSKELVKKQQQTQKVQWQLYDIHHNHEAFAVHFERMHSDYRLAADLTMIQLENQPLPFEVDVIELHCDNLLPVNFSHIADPTYQDSEIEKHALATVTAKLNARLGEHAIFTITPKDSHIPELSFKRTSLIKQTQKKPESSKNTNDETKNNRPSWIFNTPVSIGKRQNHLYWQGKLEILQGPERIEGFWWLKETARDYFIAKRDDNIRLWIFYDLHKDAWFAHGVFA